MSGRARRSERHAATGAATRSSRPARTARTARTARRVLTLLGAAAALAPTPAAAWTEARVTGGSVTVRVSPAAEAEVELDLGLEVSGGWLEHLELAGFDDGLELRERPAPVFLESETGRRLRPRVRARPGGRVSMEFRRRDAPRRGRYRVRLGYRASLRAQAEPDEASGRLRLGWTLPGWRSGLDGVEVVLEVPGDARFPPETDAHATVDRQRTAGEGVTRLRWRRAHLPRTVPWRLEVLVDAASFTAGAFAPEPPDPAAPYPEAKDPAAQDPVAPRTALEAAAAQGTAREATALPNRPPETPTPHNARRPAVASVETASPRPRTSPDATRPASTASEDAPLPPRARLLALLLALLVGLGDIAHRSRARRLGARARPLLPGPPLARATLALGLGLVGSAAPSGGLWLAALMGLLALAWQRNALPRPAGLGAWRAPRTEARRRQGRDALRERLLAFQDGAGPGGLITAALLLALLGALPAAPFPGAASLPAGLLVAGLVLLGPRRSLLPTPAAARLEALEGWAARQPSLPPLAPRVHVRPDGTWQDARLRLQLQTPAPGLVRADLVLADRPGPGGNRVTPVLLVVTRAGSFADTLLGAEAAPRALARLPSSPGGRRPRLYDAGALGAVTGLLEVGPEAGAGSTPEGSLERVEARDALGGRGRVRPAHGA